MKDYFKFLLRFCACLLPLSFLGQELPNIVPPSPEAASLGKFTEVPISHYTGLPNISVPITSCEVGGKSFPVSISYHARGLLVEEIASRVGIGWALNAGGQISRQIRDQPDDGPGGYINRSNDLMDYLSETTSGQGFFGDVNIRNSYKSQDVSTNPNRPDRHPDQFNLQAGGLSAKFIFNYDDDQPLIQSYNDIVIEYDVDDITMSEQPSGITATDALRSFMVTDKDGFKYYFGISKHGNRFARNWDKNIGSYEFYLTTSYSGPNTGTFNLSFNNWLLMDVESPSGELVSFIYEEQISEFYRRSYDTQTNVDPNLEITSYVNKMESHQFQLSEIRYDFDNSGNNYKKIVIEGTDVRQDLKSAFTINKSYELDNVKIYDNNNTLIKSFQLYQSYPTTISDGNQNSELALLEPEAAKRLRLDSIIEVGKNNVSKPPYTFTYSSQAMPHRYSNSQDFWGYYNGADNLEFLLFYNGSYGANDRTVNLEKSLAGMLERITYPTGGSTRFVYEHNRGILGSEYAHIEFPSVNPLEKRNEILTHFGHQYYVNDDYYSKPIVVNNTYGQVKFEVTLPEINGENHQTLCTSPGNDCGFEIKLEPVNCSTCNTVYLNSGVNFAWVNPGNYNLIIDPKPTLNWNEDPNSGTVYPFEVFMTWDEQAISENVLLYGAGKRIKKIEFYDSGNNLVSNKEYDYTNAGTETGIILSMSSFITINPAFTLTNFNVYRVDAATPGNNFTTYQGNTIGYEMVTEYYGDAENNHGKTEYQFTTTPDTGEYLTYPVTPPTNNEWLRGLPHTITHYKRDSNNFYKRVKKTENEYLYANNAIILPQVFQPAADYRSITSDLITQNLLYDKNRMLYRLPLIQLYHPYLNDGSLDPTVFEYKTYHSTGGTLNTFKTKETLYDENAVATLVTETETEFNYAKHYQPSEVTTVTSDGEPVVQTFTYPQEQIGSFTVHPLTYSSDPTTALAEQHRFVPLEVKTFKDANNDGEADLGEEISLTTTVYDWFGSVLEPLKVRIAKDDDPNTLVQSLTDRIEFKDYDADGNVLQVSKTNGMDITYIYGYNKTLPVAKIENATYSQISSHVTNIQNKSNLDDDHCQDSGSCDEKNLRTALNALRTAFPDAMITTYTYDPLIGVTSITDPRGYTIYYEYDDLNRLVRVKDEDGNVMSENEYQYLLDN